MEIIALQFGQNIVFLTFELDTLHLDLLFLMWHFLAHVLNLKIFLEHVLFKFLNSQVIVRKFDFLLILKSFLLAFEVNVKALL